MPRDDDPARAHLRLVAGTDVHGSGRALWGLGGITLQIVNRELNPPLLRKHQEAVLRLGGNAPRIPKGDCAMTHPQRLREGSYTTKQFDDPLHMKSMTRFVSSFNGNLCRATQGVRPALPPMCSASALPDKAAGFSQNGAYGEVGAIARSVEIFGK